MNIFEQKPIIGLDLTKNVFHVVILNPGNPGKPVADGSHPRSAARRKGSRLRILKTGSYFCSDPNAATVRALNRLKPMRYS